MTATIQDLLSRLVGRVQSGFPDGQVASGEPLPAETPRDDAHWLDRYLFDREWRAEVDGAMAFPKGSSM